MYIRTQRALAVGVSVAMVAYSYKNDVDLDDWLEEYAANNNTYFIDQRKNYLHMVNDFKQYQKRIAVA